MRIVPPEHRVHEVRTPLKHPRCSWARRWGRGGPFSLFFCAQIL